MTAPKPLLVIPLPCDGRLFCRLVDATAKTWEADHPGQTMPVEHLEQRNDTEFGKAVVVWDQPVTNPTLKENPDG